MRLTDLHRMQGATLADDGIPLHYGDLKAEYDAALTRAVLLDRSHEARISLQGDDRFTFLHRMSTNDMLNMAPGEGRPTVFTTTNARIIDRVIVYALSDEGLMIGEPGRGPALLALLQRNIFFNDKVRLSDLSSTTRQFALHGPLADRVMETLLPDGLVLSGLHGAQTSIGEIPVFVGRRKPVSHSHWVIVSPVEQATQAWQTITEAGQKHGLMPAGSLTYHTLRIRAGRPAGRELSQDYLPLEVGLWDEVSFSKGCYTGQEIIARMESRGRLAKTIVTLQLADSVDAPAAITLDNREVGTLTSSVTAPDGEVYAIGIVKLAAAQPGLTLNIGDGQTATVIARAGSQPGYIVDTES